MILNEESRLKLMQAAEEAEAEVVRWQKKVDEAVEQGNLQRAKSRRVMLERAERAAQDAFGLLNPPAVNGVAPNDGLPSCQYCAKVLASHRVAYEQGHCCDDCWAVGTKQKDPPVKSQLERMIDRAIGR